MGEEEQQRVDSSCFLYHEDEGYKDNWNMKKNIVVLEEYDASSSISSSDSTISNGSSLDMGDDASSSSNSCPSSLYDLSELMSQLPIKRGLSKFYQGKSESFTSLSRVTSIQDLAKKQIPYKKKIIESSKSYGSYKLHTLSRARIMKKSKSRGSIFSSSYSFQNRSGSFVSSSKPPLIPLEKS